MHHALVTGASRGIGLAITSQLTSSNTRVTALSRTVNLSSRDSEALVHPVAVDVGDRSSLSAVLSNSVKELGLLKKVVANAGICKRAALGDRDADDVWDSTMRVNLTGVYNTIKAAYPFLAPGARIVVVSSALGKEGRETYSAYSASKHGLLGLVRSLAIELAPKGYFINSVCPGWVDTDMAEKDLLETSRRSGVSLDAVRKQACSQIPMGRFVQPGEVASLVCWLLSDNCSAITGQSYNIGGGQSMS